jgi:hypothetical protein
LRGVKEVAGQAAMVKYDLICHFSPGHELDRDHVAEGLKVEISSGRNQTLKKSNQDAVTNTKKGYAVKNE